MKTEIDLKSQIVEALNDRAAYLLENSGSVVASILSEMEDAPDQQIMPLTREQFARLLANYESRIENPTYDNFVRERSIEGALRVNRYQPDPINDWKTQAPIDNDTQDNPGKVEPWEFYVDPIPAGYEPHSPTDNDEVELSGYDNVQESTDVMTYDDSQALMVQGLQLAASEGNDVKLELADGNDVYLSPDDVKKLIGSGFVNQLGHAMCDIRTFAQFMSSEHVPADHDFEGENE